MESSEELEQLTLNLVACKNRYFHCGGYSPSQLVFGINPRLPSDLLSDDPLQLPALGELVCDPTDQDSAASGFARSHAIRQRAREMCVRQINPQGQSAVGRKKIRSQRASVDTRTVGVLLAKIFWNWRRSHHQSSLDGPWPCYTTTGPHCLGVNEIKGLEVFLRPTSTSQLC